MDLGHTIRMMRNAFSFGKLTAHNDRGFVQTSLQDSETASDLAHPQEWGFESKAPIGQKTYSLFQAGGRDNGACLVVAGECPTKPNDGETCVYNQSGIVVKLNSSGTVTITGATALEVSGDVQDSGTVTPTMQDMRDLYNTHTHDYEEDGDIKTTATPNQPM